MAKSKSSFSLFLLLHCMHLGRMLAPYSMHPWTFSLFLLLHAPQKARHDPELHATEELSVFSYCFTDLPTETNLDPTSNDIFQSFLIASQRVGGKSRWSYWKLEHELSVFSYCFDVVVLLYVTGRGRVMHLFQSFLIASFWRGIISEEEFRKYIVSFSLFLLLLLWEMYNKNVPDYRLIDFQSFLIASLR